jgi:hypothetical protein
MVTHTDTIMYLVPTTDTGIQRYDLSYQIDRTSCDQIYQSLTQLRRKRGKILELLKSLSIKKGILIHFYFFETNVIMTSMTLCEDC